MENLEAASIIRMLHIKLPGLNHLETDIVCMTWLIILILAVLSFLAIWKMKEIPKGLQNFFEFFVESIDGLVNDTMGPKGNKFFPLIATFAIFILFSNLIGLIPRFKSPTSNLNTTVTLALVTFCTVHFYGIKDRGIINYIKHYIGEVPWLAPLMFPLHIIGELAKPLSLSFRLFGNIAGEDIVILVLLILVPIVIPVVMMGLGVFTSVLQSFIFIMLSMMYIKTMTEEEH